MTTQPPKPTQGYLRIGKKADFLTVGVLGWSWVGSRFEIVGLAVGLLRSVDASPCTMALIHTSRDDCPLNELTATGQRGANTGRYRRPARRVQPVRNPLTRVSRWYSGFHTPYLPA